MKPSTEMDMSRTVADIGLPFAGCASGESDAPPPRLKMRGPAGVRCADQEIRAATRRFFLNRVRNPACILIRVKSPDPRDRRTLIRATRKGARRVADPLRGV